MEKDFFQMHRLLDQNFPLLVVRWRCLQVSSWNILSMLSQMKEYTVQTHWLLSKPFLTNSVIVIRRQCFAVFQLNVLSLLSKERKYSDGQTDYSNRKLWLALRWWCLQLSSWVSLPISSRGLVSVLLGFGTFFFLQFFVVELLIFGLRNCWGFWFHPLFLSSSEQNVVGTGTGMVKDTC